MKLVALKFLPLNSPFKLPAITPIYGMLIDCNDSGAKVKLQKGSKVEYIWWSNMTMVESISTEEYTKYTHVIIDEVKREKATKSGNEKAGLDKVSTRDRFGCLIGRSPANINAVVTSTPKTLAQIGKECDEDPDRVLDHFNYWKKKGRGIGPHIQVKDGKYFVLV